MTRPVGWVIPDGVFEGSRCHLTQAGVIFLGTSLFLASERQDVVYISSPEDIWSSSPSSFGSAHLFQLPILI